MNFSAIKADEVIEFWPQISPGLEDLLDNHSLGTWSVDDVLWHLRVGKWQLFIVSDDVNRLIACLVCSIMEGHKKTLEIGLCWGTDANSWSGEVTDAFDQIAQEMGCDQLALDGRPGWRNIMRKHGYKLNSVRYTRATNG
jgi:hypothetical protein